MPENTGNRPCTPIEIERIMAKADGAMGAAGHSVDDPYIRNLYRRKLAGEISGEEVRRLIFEHTMAGRG